MRNDTRAYFAEIASWLNVGREKEEYTEEEIASFMCSLDTFHCMGNCTPYVISFSRNRFLFIGDNTPEVLGLSRMQVMNMDLAEFIGRVFRDEQGFVAVSGPYRRSMETLMEKYRGRFDVQLNVELGFFNEALNQKRRLLMQRRPLKWGDHSGLELLGGVMQDITRLKAEGPPRATITCNGELLEVFEGEDELPAHLVGFSRREMDIIRYTHQGKTIDELAELTGLSKATIYSHRRNIVAKSDLPNINRVIDVLKSKGLI